MGSLNTRALAVGLVALAAAAAPRAYAADLLPPPPMPHHAPMPVAIETSGWYLRGDVGVGAYEVEKVTGVDVERDGGTFIRKSIDDTAFVGVGVGYQINNFLRLDVTGEYRTSTTFAAQDLFTYNRTIIVPTSTRQTNDYKGDFASAVFMVNGYVDLGTWHGLTPFIGAGAGFAHNQMRNAKDTGLLYNYFAGTNTPLSFAFGPATESTQGHFGDAEDTSFAWALHAGVAYEATQNLKLEVAYRYLNLGDAKTGRLSCRPVCNSTNTFAPLELKEIESHDFKIGMRWLLNAPTPVAYHQPFEGPLVRKY